MDKPSLPSKRQKTHKAENKVRRVFKESDFADIDYREVGMSRATLLQYKRRFLGKPVPEQQVPDAKLLAWGYEGPDALHPVGDFELGVIAEHATAEVALVVLLSVPSGEGARLVLVLFIFAVCARSCACSHLLPFVVTLLCHGHGMWSDREPSHRRATGDANGA